jgi:arylsulfatase A-like enzyme
MKKKIYVFIYLSIISLEVVLAQNQIAKPNIIIILADDLGFKDLGFMGAKYYHTPNLDQLAKASHVYYQAYAGASNCAPSRACLLTGQNTPKHGIYTVGSSSRGNAKDRKLIPVENQEFLPTRFPTIATFLKEQGYNTASIGKWHIGSSPLNYSFDYNFAGNDKGHNNHFLTCPV